MLFVEAPYKSLYTAGMALILYTHGGTGACNVFEGRNQPNLNRTSTDAEAPRKVVHKQLRINKQRNMKMHSFVGSMAGFGEVFTNCPLHPSSVFGGFLQKLVQGKLGFNSERTLNMYIFAWACYVFGEGHQSYPNRT